MKKFIRDLLYQISDHLMLGYGSYYEYAMSRYLKENLRIRGDVLDIGCGYSGKNLKKISGSIKNGVGIDIATPDHKFGNLTFMNVDVEKKLPFPSNSFDYVTCFEVIEHIRNDKNLMSEIIRVLKPKGYLVLSTPYLPAMLKHSDIRKAIYKKSGHVRLGYELDFFEKFKRLKVEDFWFINKGSLNQLISIRLFTKLQPLFYYIFLSPLYRFLTAVFYFYDMYSNKEGADIFLVMQKK